ncbi:MAG: hypothetical protein OT477_16530 [Chloroflexi bacterium]|nr:hypothetical protein [Chloroflexota bacterium]
MISNPYILGTTVQNEQMFFGRMAELATLREQIGKGSSTAVVGLRRIGKSSLLYHLTHHDSKLPDQTAITYLDLLDGRYHTRQGLLMGILAGLNKAVNQRYRWDTPCEMPAFIESIRQMKEDGYQPVVCLDELERLMHHPDIFDKDFFNAWRSLGSMGTLAFVTASRLRLADVVQHNGETSPFTNIFTQMMVGGLDHPAATQLLRIPFRAAQRTPPPDSHIEFALSLTGRHPYFVQIGGHTLWQIDGTNREQLREHIGRAAREPMRQLWADLSTTEQAAALRLATGKGAVPNYELILDDLRQTGLVQRDERGNDTLFSDFLYDWLAQGVFKQTADARPLGGQPKGLPNAATPTPRPATAPLYAYALVVLACVLIALVVVLILPTERFWLFFITLSIMLPFVLVGVDKLTGNQFLGWLTKILSHWK